MSYQGSGMNGADGLGLRLSIPKGIKKRIKKLGRGLKRLSKSPTVRGAAIGAAAGFIYGQVQKRRRASKAARDRQAAIDRANAGLDALGPVKVRPLTPSTPAPVPWIEPPNIPLGPAGIPLPPATGGTPNDGGPSMATRQAIGDKIMRGIPLTPEEMAIVEAGYLGQGMKLAAEAAYGSDAYVPGAGQALPGVTVTAKQDDNTMLYAGMGLVGLLLLTSRRR